VTVDLGESKKISLPVIALVLWVVTVVLASWDFLAIRDMVLRTYARLFPLNTLQNQEVFTLIHTILVIILAIGWIAVVIAGAEFHYKRVGQPISWRMFSRTLAVEISILILALFI
jgi:uncharacterized membrane protein